MGGGSKRKSNDKLRINSPKARREGKGSGAGGGSRTFDDAADINHVCPQVFRIRIEPSNQIKDGAAVSVRGDKLYVFGEEVGKLSSDVLARIATCTKLGVRYVAEVSNVGTKTYAIFEQAE